MIYIAADHRGFQLKEEIKKFLEERNIVFADLGNDKYEQGDDFPVFAAKTAKAVLESAENRGVLVCGSGIGMAMAANRFSGIRAGLCSNKEMAVAGRNDDDMNILVLPADFIDSEKAKEIVSSFLEAKFSNEERHIRRIKMLDNS